ncbi:hypothetical protein PFDG_04617, partial [Plasmodium falciparum Dd2]
IYKPILYDVSIFIYLCRTPIGQLDEEAHKNILHQKIKPQMLKPVN